MGSIGETPTRIPTMGRSSLSFGSSTSTSGVSGSPSSATSSTTSRSFKSFRALLPFGPSQSKETKKQQKNKDERKFSLNIDSPPRKSDVVFTPRKSSFQQGRAIPQSFLPVLSIEKKDEPSFEDSVRRTITLTNIERDRLAQKRGSSSTVSTTKTSLLPPPSPSATATDMARPSSSPRSSLVPSPRSSVNSHAPSAFPVALAQHRSATSLPNATPASAIPPTSQLRVETAPEPMADLSTITEAETSGVSINKHLPSPSPSPHPEESPLDASPSEESQLELSVSQLDSQVRDAMVSSPGWRSRPSEEADISLNLQDVNPDIAALLSPNNLATPQPITPFVRRQHPSSLPRLRPRMSVTPPPESPGISLGSPGPSGRISPRPPHSPHRPSPPSPLGRIRPSPVRTSSHEALLPALEATPTGQTSIYPPPRGTVSSRPSLDVPPPPSAERTRKRSMSAVTPPRSLGMSQSRGSVEWLGPRTFKAFRAAGLLDETPSQHIRAGSMGDVRDKYTAVEPMQRFGGTLSRLGSRSDRSASRLSSSRRSPSSMAESPRSASTAPTRSSTAPSSVVGWEDDSAAKHAMEMSALLGALSDSQRTAKMLRDDNDELRERLDVTERERDRLERERDRLEEMLKERDEELTAVSGRPSGIRDEDERLNDLEDENAVLRSVVDELRREIGDILGSTSGPILPPSPLATGEADARLFGSRSSRPMQSTPKRMSSASSIFPPVPPNMTMLMSDESQEERWEEEEGEEEEDEDCRQWDQEEVENDADQSMMEDSFDTEDSSRDGDEGEPTWTVRKGNVRQSILSDLSFLTGDEESLRSLALRPEHEMHLQDLDGMSIYDMPSAS